MDQICKFGEQTSRILEFKPKGLEGQYFIKYIASNFFQTDSADYQKLAFKPFGREFQNSRCLFTEFANLIHFGRKIFFAERHSDRQTDRQTDRRKHAHTSQLKQQFRYQNKNPCSVLDTPARLLKHTKVQFLSGFCDNMKVSLEIFSPLISTYALK